MPRTQTFQILGYVPAEAHFGATTYIDYYVPDPVTREKRRVRLKLNHVPKEKRRVMARRVVHELNIKLAAGWNPLVTGSTIAEFHTMDQVLDHYVATKERDTNHSSPKAYISFTGVFRRWCLDQDLLQKVPSAFTRTHALRFLDYVLEERKVGRTTYNNYILRCSILMIWMIEREYRTDNPFKGIKRKRVEEKFRTILSPEERGLCFDWFMQHDPPMAIVCLFVFHTLLRPRSELLRIRCGFVDLPNGVINVNGTQSKSKRIRRPAIPDVMIPYLVASPLATADPAHYVVGKGLLPGPRPSGHNTVGYRWNRMREALGWTRDKTLYSLRDTGIVQLLSDGLDLHFVMRQADHRDIATTNRYVQHYFPQGIEAIRRGASAFRPSAFKQAPKPAPDPAQQSGQGA